MTRSPTCGKEQTNLFDAPLAILLRMTEATEEGLPCKRDGIFRVDSRDYRFRECSHNSLRQFPFAGDRHDQMYLRLLDCRNGLSPAGATR